MAGADKDEGEGGQEGDECGQKGAAHSRGGVADRSDGMGHRPGGHLPERDRVQELRAGHPVVAIYGVTLHQRDDHEAAAVREGADLQRRPGQGKQAAAGSADNSQKRPGMEAEALARRCGAPQQNLRQAAGDQDQDQPGADQRPGHPAEQRVGDPASMDLRPIPARGDQADAGPHSDGGDCRAGSSPGTAHPDRRRARQEEHRESQDHQQAGQDEAEAPEQRARAATHPPGAEDRQLGRRRAGEQVAGGDRVLELVRREPGPPLDAELAQQGDVGGRATEPDATDPPPLSGDLTVVWLGSARHGGNLSRT